VVRSDPAVTRHVGVNRGPLCLRATSGRPPLHVTPSAGRAQSREGLCGRAPPPRPSSEWNDNEPRCALEGVKASPQNVEHGFGPCGGPVFLDRRLDNDSLPEEMLFHFGNMPIGLSASSALDRGPFRRPAFVTPRAIGPSALARGRHSLSQRGASYAATPSTARQRQKTVQDKHRGSPSWLELCRFSMQGWSPFDI